MISTDTFQSAEFHQILQDKGFTTQIRSLDRTPEGYHILREAMVEDRIEMIKHNKIEDELIHLQRDTNTGKLDHPANGCFTQDTQIKLTDGRSLSIEELLSEQQSGKENYVYAINCRTGRVEHSRIKRVFPTKMVSSLVRVHLDNGAVIRCTPEHRFMLPDGSFVEIQKLCSGTALMTCDNSVVKIKTIIAIPYLGTVYDLEIEDNHNFTLEAGVVVHNSKDISDSLAGAIWDLSLLPYDPGLSDMYIGAYGDVDDMMPVMRQGLFHGLREYNPYNFDRI